MFRAYVLIFLLHLSLILPGCAGPQRAEDVAKEEPKKAEAKKTEAVSVENKTAGELEKLTQENINLQRQVRILRKDNERLFVENQRLRGQFGEGTSEKQTASADTSLPSQETSKPNTPQQNSPPSQGPVQQPEKKERPMRELKIKVLSGNGDLNSAKEMAKKLEQIGYEVKAIDHSPRSNFVRNTVYFVSGLQEEARQLGLNIGGLTLIKPLDWSSIFDIIVVTGRNP